MIKPKSAREKLFRNFPLSSFYLFVKSVEEEI